MVIRTKKNVPLYEKFGLFTEAPRRKKRIINIKTSRAKDYTADVDPEEVTLNNISPEEDELSSGEVDGLNFDNPDDLEGGVDNAVHADTDAQTDLSGDDNSGSDVQQNAGDSEGAAGTAPANTTNDAGSNATGSGTDNGEVSGIPEGDGGSTPDNVSGEPQEGEVPPADTSTTGGDNTGGNAGGRQAIQTDEEPASGTGDDGNAGAVDPGTENPANINGEGDVTNAGNNPVEPVQPEVTAPAEANEVIEIDDPSAEDDFTAGVDADGTTAPDSQTDPTAAPADLTTDPNAAMDPNASVNADLEAFDKNDMRKYQLFKRFIDLHDVTLHFVSTLEAIISDDADYGEIISKVTKKLKRVEEILKDYMVLKFQSDSYLQNSFFFEKSKASILLALEMLKRGKNLKDVSKQ